MIRKPGKGSTLLERLEWVLEENRWTHEQFSHAAGFSSRSHISSLISRLRKDPDFANRLSLSQYQKLAHGAGQPLVWIQAGEGEPGSTVSSLNPRYPNLMKLVLKDGDKWSRGTIAYASSLPIPSDLSVHGWRIILDKIEVKFAQGFNDMDEEISTAASR